MSNDPTLTNQALHDRLFHRQQTIDQQARHIDDLEDQNHELTSAAYSLLDLLNRGSGYDSPEYQAAALLVTTLTGSDELPNGTTARTDQLLAELE